MSDLLHFLIPIVGATVAGIFFCWLAFYEDIRDYIKYGSQDPLEGMGIMDICHKTGCYTVIQAGNRRFCFKHSRLLE